MSIFNKVPSSWFLAPSLAWIDSFTIYLKISTWWFTYLSTSKSPSFSIFGPNMKLRKVRSWAPTLDTNLSRKTESSTFYNVSSNLRPKNDLTTVRPAIPELNSIELIMRGVSAKSDLNSLNLFSTIDMILGTKVSKNSKWNMELIIFLLLLHSLPSAKATPSPKTLILFSMKNLSLT